MYKLTKLLATTALIAGASSAALAQADVNVDAGADGAVGVEAGDNGVGVDVGAGAEGNAGAGLNGNANANADANAAGNASAGVNYGQIISDLRTGGVTVADIEGLEAGADVQIVTLSEIRGNAAENASALDEAVSSLEASIGELRTVLEANAEISAELEAEGYTADDVVAVTTSADGSVTIIVDDEM